MESLTRQRHWQLNMIARGRCQSCGRPRNLFKNYCDECGIKMRQRMRRQTGSHVWKEGSKGRPPKGAKHNA